MTGLNLYYRHIDLRIGADDLCCQLAFIVQYGLNILGPGDHVVVGHDVAVIGVDDHAGTQTLNLAVLLRHIEDPPKNGSLNSGFCTGTRLRVAMFTTDGVTFSTIGARVGKG